MGHLSCITYPPFPLINVGKYRVFSNKKGKNHPIINIESGGRGELTSCPNTFVRDCRYKNSSTSSTCSSFTFILWLFLAFIRITFDFFALILSPTLAASSTSLLVLSSMSTYLDDKILLKVRYVKIQSFRDRSLTWSLFYFFAKCLEILMIGSLEIGTFLLKQSLSIFRATAHALLLTGFFSSVTNKT